MSIYISVVSHGHGDLIKNLSCLSNLARYFTVVVKLNRKEKNLISYLRMHNINCIDESYQLGFGHNNNIIYSFCISKLCMKDEDYFIVFNPDVISSKESILDLVEFMSSNNIYLASVNLFKDKEFTISDDSVRTFPHLSQFINSFLGFRNSSIVDKSILRKPVVVDWAAGSFLAFKASHYGRLNGFDEKYFMYCEDIDICFRSKAIGVPVFFHPNIKMQHLAGHANRSLFSKHFYWHVTSVIRFLISRFGLTKMKSSIVVE